MSEAEQETTITGVIDSDKEKRQARTSLKPETNATLVVDTYNESFWGKQDLFTLKKAVTESIAPIQKGDLKRCEAMLMGQAIALESIFTNLARRAMHQENSRVMEILLRLSLKAQNQCRSTLETLTNMKNPPIIYAKQANIANGHQQVNNGIATQSQEVPVPDSMPEKINHPNELLSETTHETLDNSGTRETSRVDIPMETMAAVNRS